MKKFTTLMTIVLSGLMSPVAAFGAESADTLFVTFTDGSIVAFPEAMIKERKETENLLTINTIHGKTFRYAQTKIAKLGNENPIGETYNLTQFKLNNKYNDQLHQDLDPVIGANTVSAEIGGIGKWLTPSFKLDTEDGADLYLDNEKLVTKESRHDYSFPRVLTVAKENQSVYDSRMVEPAVYGDIVEEFDYSYIEMTPDQFSTNAPSGRGEGPDKLIDGNWDTFFHSTWGNDDPAGYKPLPYYPNNPSRTQWPYLDIHFPHAISEFKWFYVTRRDMGRSPRRIEMLASNDGKTWKSVKMYSADEGDNPLPKGRGALYESTNVSLGGSYEYLRLQLWESENENDFVLAELGFSEKIYNDPELVGKPEVLKPAVYENNLFPLGHNYTTDFTWLTDGRDVPKIYIDIDNGAKIGQYGQEVYHSAAIRIDGSGVFPDLEEMDVQVKGRGNSSWDNSVMWGDNPKNPYRLKFDKKQKPLGMTNGKNWVLLANKQWHSMMTNAVGMKIARLVGTAAANHMTPVDLYVNGEFRGSYNLTEKVGFSNNSIELEDETYATLLELDTYYDEEYKFLGNWYGLPVNVKEPDLNETSDLTLDEIKDGFRKLMNAIHNANVDKTVDISDVVDVDALARFLMVNDLIYNGELHHPKSTYVYNANLRDDTQKWIFGPVWDLDWAYGYEGTWDYCTNNPQLNYWTSFSNMEHGNFVRAARNIGNEVMDKAYYRVWHKFMEEGQLEELLDFCDDYYKYAATSFNANAQKWGDGYDYAGVTGNMKYWLEARANYIYSKLTPYDLDDDDSGVGVVEEDSRNSLDGLVTIYDLNGRCLARNVKLQDVRSKLSNGIYIINGRKYVVR